MTYKRWKEINHLIRYNPRFNMTKCEEFGVTRKEIDQCLKEVEYPIMARSRYRAKGCAIISAICFSIFAIPMGAALIGNYFQTRALEHLTGKDLSYWDVFFAGDVIRANAEIQSPRKN